jgi:alpha-glucosidase
VSVHADARPAPEAKLDAEWWRGAVIYHVYPLSYCDTNGDGYGDLKGVTERLDYIHALGVDAIWLSPFFTSPMRDFGYDVADFCDVDPLFGALADFDALLARAHALGLKVIIDQVYSHTSDQHAWFRESRSSRDNPKADWYVWADAKADGAPPTNWQSVFKSAAWSWDARRRQYYLHNFQAEQPDLNVRNPEVQEALLTVARFWLDRGVDGFRMDAVNFAMHDPLLRDNPPVPEGIGKRTRPFDFQRHLYNQSHPDIPKFISRVRRLADSYGARFLVAEVGGEQADVEMKLYTEPGERMHSAYGFHYLYAGNLTPALVRSCSQAWARDDEGWPSWAFSNHDAPRVISRWAGRRDERAFAKFALLLLTTLRGSIFLYQGEELGLPQGHVPFERLRDPEAIANWPDTLGRDGARTPMPWRSGARNAGFTTGEPWLPIDPSHIPLAVDAMERDPASTLHFARKAIALRKTYPALRAGGVSFLDLAEPLIGFVRGAGQESMLCVFNLGADPAPWTLPAGWIVVESVNQPAGADGKLAPLAGLLARRT